MRKLIQFVGIPGVGKSYLFRKIGLKGLNYVEFGTEFAKWIAKRDGDGQVIVPDAPKKYVYEFMDTIINNRQPAIFTSHIVHFDGQKFRFDSEMEMYIACGGYIYVYSSPEEILQRRKRDNESGIKIRGEDMLETITKHQELSLQLAREYSNKLGSKFLYVNNTSTKEEESLKNIRDFIQEVIFNGSPV